MLKPSAISLTLLTITIFSFAPFAALGDTKIYNVEGMHCGECAKMIEKKVCVLPGLSQCSVELGKITLQSSEPIAKNTIQAALSTAGDYKIISEGNEGTKATTPVHPHHKKNKKQKESQ